MTMYVSSKGDKDCPLNYVSTHVLFLAAFRFPSVRVQVRELELFLA